MNKKVPLFLMMVLLSASPVFAEGNGHNREEKRSERIEALVTSATTSDGNVTQSSLETAMQDKAKELAAKMFQKLSPNGDPVTPEQLTEFLNSHAPDGFDHKKSSDE